MAQNIDKIFGTEEDIQTIRSYISVTIESPPSCLEFMPRDPDMFVVGTYTLEANNETSETSKASQLRSGSLLLYRIEDQVLNLCASFHTPYAVLDLHFTSKDKALFAVATSVGSIDLYCISKLDSVTIEKTRSFQICDPSVLVLSLTWAEGLLNNEQSVGLSLSNGQVGCLSYTTSEQIVKLTQAHSMEAWCIAWPNEENDSSHTVLYSGGDDSVLCKSGGVEKTRGEESLSQLSLQSLGRETKAHSAGVTAILPLPVDYGSPEVLLTGSYDEHVRLLTLGEMGKKAKILAEERLHGGVWRLKLLQRSFPTDDLRFGVLASCMHAGTRVLSVEKVEDQWTIRTVAKFVEHGSMNYASDARNSGSDENPGMTVVSSSFYDRMICVWDLDRLKM